MLQVQYLHLGSAKDEATLALIANNTASPGFKSNGSGITWQDR
jgi:hypothetical protein